MLLRLLLCHPLATLSQSSPRSADQCIKGLHTAAPSQLESDPIHFEQEVWIRS
jgi:hypothetical protein